MAQIIAICKEHKIANVCSFSLDREEGLTCTTCLTEEEFDPPDEFRECVKLLFPRRAPVLMMTVRDGDGKVALSRQSNTLLNRPRPSAILGGSRRDP